MVCRRLRNCQQQ